MSKQWIEITRERANQAAEAILKNYGQAGRDLYFDVENDEFYTTIQGVGDLDGDRFVSADVCDPNAWNDDEYDEEDPDTKPAADIIANTIFWDCRDDFEAAINEAE